MKSTTRIRLANPSLPGAFQRNCRRLSLPGISGLLILLTILGSSLSPSAAAQSYAQQVFFENSLSPAGYFYSEGNASPPSNLSLVGGKLPIESANFISGPNSLRLQWQSTSGGGWDATLHLYAWRNRDISFPGSNFYLWIYPDSSTTAVELPRIALKDLYGNFTAPIELAPYAAHLVAGRWLRLCIPLTNFRSASLHPFQPHRVNTIYFTQGATDGHPHSLLIDDIRIEDDAPAGQPVPRPVTALQATGYERHVDISWSTSPGSASPEPFVSQYVIYRSLNGAPARPIGVQRPGVNRYCDYLGDSHATATYTVTARTSTQVESPHSAPVTASTHPMTDDEILTMVQQASFRYYWEGAEPHSGMTRENLPGEDDIVATGASGFGIMALIVAADRGFIPRSDAVGRLLRITAFLAHADRYHGAWPHFLSGSTGHRLPVFDIFDNGADLVETSFLVEGLLAAGQYFRGSSPQEQQLGAQIAQLWLEVDWDWFRATPIRDALYWHWSPEYAWHIANRLTGWNEVMVTYLLALASPTHPVPASTYNTGWVGEAVHNPYTNGKSYFGIPLDVGGATGGPLFFTHYSFMGFDPHALRDKYTGYFENNRNISRINHAYCIANPNHWKGFAADTWGITAVDGPDGYVPYEATAQLDDGTLAPTGAVSAIVYTPEASLAAIRHYYRDLGAQLWDIYGFRDAFNLQRNWYSGITMGLNQAPMIVMIENHRTGLVWNSFMSTPGIRPMLDRVGLHNDAAPAPSR